MTEEVGASRGDPSARSGGHRRVSSRARMPPAAYRSRQSGQHARSRAWSASRSRVSLAGQDHGRIAFVARMTLCKRLTARSPGPLPHRA
jgi:hypothetical protein